MDADGRRWGGRAKPRRVRLLQWPNWLIFPFLVPAFWMAPLGFLGAVVNTVVHFVKRRRGGTWMVVVTMSLTTVVPPVFLYLVVKYD